MLLQFRVVDYLMTRQQKIELMLWRARRLAGLGHCPQVIETAFLADGFSEASELIQQAELERELSETAERVRNQKRANIGGR